MDRVEAWLRNVERTAHRPVDERVVELLENIRRGSEKHDVETWDQANERHAEEFIARLREQFPGCVIEVRRPPLETQEIIIRRALAPAAEDAPPVVLVERQKLPPMARRTTDYNYIFTVPGERPERLILIAHYDTWRGPGADDNTTGEEITKQYLVNDLRAPRRPKLTHTYILAGSEECGLIGFTSQVLLALGIGVANMALTKGFLAITALALAMVPLAKFRFGVSGSREYVSSLKPEEMALVQSVISVDSVGEGKMYIPESSLGADFVRAFIPFEGYEQLNDVLEEAAHLNGIRFNSFIAGGTTDHVSFLEVNSGLRDYLGDLLGCPRCLGCHKHGKRKIPASALVALVPGKASPLVFGGKIHTPNDTPDRVYPGPLADALRIIDYWYHLMHGGERIADPRHPAEYHYARLYSVRLKDGAAEYWLALKDAVEPNRRNINGVYRVEVEISGERAVCRNPQVLNWGVESELDREVGDHTETIGAAAERVRVREIELTVPTGAHRFGARGAGWWGWLQAVAQKALGEFERFMGSNTFLTFFGAAFALAKLVDILMTQAFGASMAFQQWFFNWFVVTLPLTVALQLWAVLWLIGTKIPTMIDNAYKHLNKADNLRSLRRASMQV
jgi:hypothetical protein